MAHKFSGRTYRGIASPYENKVVSFTSDSPLTATWVGDTIRGKAMGPVEMTGSFVAESAQAPRRLFQIQGEGSVTIDGKVYHAVISVCGFQELDAVSGEPRTLQLVESYAEDAKGNSEIVTSYKAGGFKPA